MGQAEIIEILKKLESPISGRKIAEILNQSWQGVVSTTLKKLLDKGEIKCIELDGIKAKKYFNSKRKLRLYYISILNKRDFIRANKTLSYL